MLSTTKVMETVDHGAIYCTNEAGCDDHALMRAGWLAAGCCAAALLRLRAGGLRAEF